MDGGKGRVPVCSIDAGGRKLVLDTADFEASLVLVIREPAGHLRQRNSAFVDFMIQTRC